MTVEKLIEILNDIQQHKSETQTLEIKCAAKGCPRKLFDTLSSFSNQDDGGSKARIFVPVTVMNQ